MAVMMFSAIAIGWGINDIQQLLAHPARAMLLVLLLVQFLMAGIFAPLSSLNIHQQDYYQISKLVTVLGVVGSTLFLFVSAFSDNREWMQLFGGDWMRYFGLVLFTMGSLLSTWATVHVSKRFGEQQVVQADRYLITDGPFRYIRHPRCFGGILMFVGVPLIFLSSLGLLLALVSAVGLLERIGRQERVLQQAFKEEWTMYAQRTRCFIPWVY
jgi:protein-S-isoprenylcysteine O-methyltransferase Ste14